MSSRQFPESVRIVHRHPHVVFIIEPHPDIVHEIPPDKREMIMGSISCAVASEDVEIRRDWIKLMMRTLKSSYQHGAGVTPIVDEEAMLRAFGASLGPTH